MGRLVPLFSFRVALVSAIFLLLLSSCVPPNKTKLPAPFPITITDPITISNKKSNGHTGPSGTVTVLEFEKLRQEIESFPKSLAEAKSDIYSTFIDALAVGVAILTLIILVIGAGWWFYLAKYMGGVVAEKIGPLIKDDVEKIHGRYDKSVRFLQIETYAAYGYMDWGAGRIEGAISSTELALSLKPTEEVKGRIQSNLAYYYAERERLEDKEKALELSADSVQMFKKFPHKIAWLANDVFVRIKYAETLEELNDAIQETNRLHRLYPDLREEMESYLGLAEEKDEELRQLEMGNGGGEGGSGPK